MSTFLLFQSCFTVSCHFHPSLVFLLVLLFTCLCFQVFTSLLVCVCVFQAASDALNSLGHVYTAIGDFPNALASHKQCVLLARQTQCQLSEARQLGNMGAVYTALGDFTNAVQCHEQHLDISKVQYFPHVLKLSVSPSVKEMPYSRKKIKVRFPVISQGLSVWRLSSPHHVRLGLAVHSELTIGVNASVNGCLQLEINMEVNVGMQPTCTSTHPTW